MAMKRLFEAGNEPLPKVREAMNSNDLEVRFRAMKIVEAVQAKRGSVWECEETYEDSVQRLLNRGFKLFKIGALKESNAKFEEAFQLKPNADMIYVFIERVGVEAVAEMMNSVDRMMQDVGRRLFQLAR